MGMGYEQSRVDQAETLLWTKIQHSSLWSRMFSRIGSMISSSKVPSLYFKFDDHHIKVPQDILLFSDIVLKLFCIVTKRKIVIFYQFKENCIHLGQDFQYVLFSLFYRQKGEPSWQWLVMKLMHCTYVNVGLLFGLKFSQDPTFHPKT